MVDRLKHQFRRHQILLVVLVLAASMSTSAISTWLTTRDLTLPERLQDMALAVSITVMTASALLAYTIRVQSRYLQLHLRLDELANTDHLTGLANRRCFVSEGKARLAQARADGTQLALLLVDVDWFKRVNDTYGHDAGDKALCHIAKTLQQAAPDEALVARLGGEEFTVLCQVESREEMREIAKSLRRQVEATQIVYKGEVIRTTISIGLALTRQGDTLSTLLSHADHALYDAKHCGRNRFAMAA
tara:strand:- start:129441 stop:130178 length:738 start_codon:yes stop_codon:yes gene_type:complete